MAAALGLGLGASALILVAIETADYRARIAQQGHEFGKVWAENKGKPTASSEYVQTKHIVEQSSTASETLKLAGLPGPLVHDLITAARPYTNLGNIPSKSIFSLFWDPVSRSELRKVEFPISKLECLVLERAERSDQWAAKVTVREVEKIVETFQGSVDSSLWDSATSAGIDSSVISKLADIFAWQINFSRELQQGDTWRLSIERDFADNKPIGWGEIIAAEFTNRGETYSAVRYTAENGSTSYYDRNGESLRRMFLKSPVRFSRITSGFTSRRMHPILKINRPHHGVDYGAPTGTPVYAVGDGVIVHASYDGSSGNMVKINHNSTYSTSYHHLSGFAQGVRAGRKVSQGDLVGYVGSTGLATGPHLHFAFYERGVYVDPQGLKFPSADPVKPAERPQFLASAETAFKSLPTWDVRLSQVGPPLGSRVPDLVEAIPAGRTH